jgi:hypothetical protein
VFSFMHAWHSLNCSFSVLLFSTIQMGDHEDDTDETKMGIYEVYIRVHEPAFLFVQTLKSLSFGIFRSLCYCDRVLPT